MVSSPSVRCADECLNMHVFHSVAEVRVVLTAYRRQYHEERPHSSVGYRPPRSSSASGSYVRRNSGDFNISMGPDYWGQVIFWRVLSALLPGGD
jgi:hypothetical protein